MHEPCIALFELGRYEAEPQDKLYLAGTLQCGNERQNVMIFWYPGVLTYLAKPSQKQICLGLDIV